jgi:uncharacterized protein
MNTGIALVTGASSGLGSAFARALAENASERGGDGRGGLRAVPAFDELWLVARRADRLEALAAELSGIAPGLTVRVRPADLVSSGAIAALAAEVAVAKKPLRVLVNDAGYGSYGPFADAPLDLQLGQIDLNCRALTELCGRLRPFLDSGSLVVNVASLAAFAPLGGFAVYAATKAYVLSFSVGIAAEWAERGIRVVALCPGPVSSEFSLVASGGARKEVLHGFSPEKTVRRCLKAAGRGAWISVPRCIWRLRRFAGGLAGPVLSARFTQRFMKRPSAGKG